MRYFAFLFHPKSEICCVIYIYTHLNPDSSKLRVLSNHGWLVATVLVRANTELLVQLP